MKIERILAPVDFSEFSGLGVLQAAELAEQFGADLVVLNMVATNQAEAMVYFPGNPWEQVVGDMSQELDGFVRDSVPEELLRKLNVRKLVNAGVPSIQIARAAEDEDVDVIVMATHGRTGVAHAFLGSVAEAVVRIARKPVWTVRKKRSHSNGLEGPAG